MESKFTWHSLLGEYELKDGETVLLADPEGYHLCRYDKQKDVWIDQDGRESVGGLAMMPLPDPRHAMEEAWEQVKDKPYAHLGRLAEYINN